jgi:hypothetical protein
MRAGRIKAQAAIRAAPAEQLQKLAAPAAYFDDGLLAERVSRNQV